MTLAGAKWHVSEIITKFGVQTREEAVDAWRADRSMRRRLARGAHALVAPLIAHKLVSAAAAALVVAVGVAVVVIIRTPPPSVGSARPLTEMACPVQQYSSLGYVAPLVSCGTVAVPERRDIPGSKTIDVAYVVFHATNKKDGARDPLLFVSPSPFIQAVTAGAAYYQNVIQPVTSDRRDVILFDERGAGLSKPGFLCDFSNRVPVSAAQAMATCHDQLQGEGVDLDAYTSSAVADDAHDLMYALGYRHYNVLTFGYGTRVAELLLRQHAGEIRSEIVSSPIPLDANWMADAPANFQEAVDALAKACAAQPGCANAHPDLRSELSATTTRLDAAPHTLEIRPAGSAPRPYVVDGHAFLTLVQWTLQNSPAAVLPLPALSSQVAAGQFSQFDVLAAPIFASIVNSSIGYGRDSPLAAVQYAFLCHEDAPFETPQLVAAAEAGVAHPLLEIRDVPPTLERCLSWSASQPDPSWHQPVVSNVPVLVLSGEYDPNSPPQYGGQLASTLKNATYVELPGTGTPLFMKDEPCATSLASQFLDNPHKALAPSCQRAISEPVFPTTLAQ